MGYHILILEDNKIDASLMEEYLKRSKEPFDKITKVSTREEFERVLENKLPDLIISDYRLPDINGSEAIKIKNTYNDDIPLIIVSATIGEESAIELIREGAADFLIKNNIKKRLAQVAMRAIQETKEKHNRRIAEYNLKRSEEKYSLLFESSLDGIIIGLPDEAGRIIDANSAICELLGYTYNDFLKLERNDIVSDRKISQKNKKRHDNRFFKGEIWMIHKNGTHIPVETTSRIMELENGELRSFSIIRDIRERKEAEKEIARQQEVQKLQKDIGQILNENKSFHKSLEECVHRINEFLEWDVGHLYRRFEQDNSIVFKSSGIISYNDYANISDFVDDTLEKTFVLQEGYVGKVAASQSPKWFFRKKGNEDFLRLEAVKSHDIRSGVLFPIVIDGQTEAVLEFFAKAKKQITSETQKVLEAVIRQLSLLFERRAHQYELEKQIDLNEKIINSLPGIFFIISNEGKVTRVNDKLKDITGYDPEIEERDYTEFVATEDLDLARSKFREAFENGHAEAELRVITRDGSSQPYLITAIVDKLNKNDFLIGAGVDISERRDAESKLKAEQDFTEMALNSLPGLFYVLDEDQNYVRVNDGFVEALGYSRTELDNMNPLDFYLKEDHENIINTIEKVFEKGFASVVAKVRTKDGNLPYFYITGSHFVQDGKNYILGTGIDITEQIRLERLLKQAHDMARIGAWEVDLVNDKIIWTKVTREIHEVPEDFEPKLETAINFYKEGESREKITDVIETAIEEGEPYDVELQIVTAKNNTKWVRAIGKPYFSEGKCISLYGSFQDITDQKQREEKILEGLREREVLLQEIHHRVKNNLALVSGMLQLQAFAVDDPSLSEILNDSQSRIKSIALLHEQLYSTESFSKIDLQENLSKLVDHIHTSFSIGGQIAIELNMAQISLNINQAVPLTLIINEIITNSIKHAFKGQKEGKIGISVERNKDALSIKIQDNGCGLPENFDIHKAETLGFTLVKTLSSQLGAALDISSDSKGTAFELKFDIKDQIRGSSGNIE